MASIVRDLFVNLYTVFTEKIEIMRYTLLALLLFFSLPQLYAQGCSDAGFCTLPGVQVKDDTERSHQLSLSLNHGQADHDIAIWGGYLQYAFSPNKKWQLNARMTFIQQEGSLTRSRGLSDLFLSATHTIKEKTGLSLGLKLPLGNGNETLNGSPLPMDYQPSLGTIDALLSVKHRFDKVNLSLAYQQPLRQNENAFTGPTDTMDPLAIFQPTNEYIRQPDIFLRADYLLYHTEKLSISPGLLPIYHLANDRFTNAAGEEEAIEGSQGLTLNATLLMKYKLQDKQHLALSFGAPLLVREARPDGLTRHFVVNLEYSLGW